MSGVKVTDTSNAASSDSVTTVGKLFMNSPLSPVSSSSGRNAKMLISVPNTIGCRR